MRVVKCKTFKNSEELEKWQKDNVGVLIKQIIPIPTGTTAKSAGEHCGNAEMQTSLQHNVFITFIEIWESDPLMKILGLINHHKYDEAVEKLLKMIRARDGDIPDNLEKEK